MPLVQITIVEGRDEALVQDCIRTVARTVSDSLRAPLETVRVVVHEVPATRWAVGTTLKSEQASAPSGTGRGETTHQPEAAEEQSARPGRDGDRG
ncbi:MAG: tautomerase family protein [Actinomycetales bacterium]